MKYNAVVFWIPALAGMTLLGIAVQRRMDEDTLSLSDAPIAAFSGLIIPAQVVTPAKVGVQIAKNRWIGPFARVTYRRAHAEASLRYS